MVSLSAGGGGDTGVYRGWGKELRLCGGHGSGGRNNGGCGYDKLRKKNNVESFTSSPGVDLFVRGAG